jgi:hypothetical protein
LAALLIVENHLRCRFAHFTLGAHLLDLRCMLFQGGCAHVINWPEKELPSPPGPDDFVFTGSLYSPAISSCHLDDRLVAARLKRKTPACSFVEALTAGYVRRSI